MWMEFQNLYQQITALKVRGSAVIIKDIQDGECVMDKKIH